MDLVMDLCQMVIGGSLSWTSGSRRGGKMLSHFPIGMKGEKGVELMG